MRKITTLLMLAALLGSNTLSAQTVAASPNCPNSSCGIGKKKDCKQVPAPCPKDETALGLGICGILVIGAVAGVTGWMASQSN